MVDSKSDRQGVRGKDPVPDLGVSGVSGPESGSGQASYPVRMLDGETFMAHYRHLQVRRAKFPESRACCRTPPEGILQEVETPAPEPDVVQGARVDEEVPGAPAPGRWWAE